jgi:Xaa-Pro aminopeptidase
MSPEFFVGNRQALMENLKGGLVVLSGYKAMQWANDAAMPFKQEANFWYLTGVDQPDWWVVIEGSKAKTWLIAPELRDHTILFDGQSDVKSLQKESGAYEVMSREKGGELLRQLARQHHLVYTTSPPHYFSQLDMVLNPAQNELHKILERTFTNVQLCNKQLAKLRSLKQTVELKKIESATKIAVAAYKSVYENLDQYKYEYEIEAHLSQIFRSQGAEGHAYSPIVASGRNALTLHYCKNEAKLQKNRSVLIDAAPRIGGYASDITRTYIIGTPTKRQRDIHEALQKAQKSIIQLCQIGKSIHVFQEEADVVMKETILSLGLVGSPKDDQWRAVFPHAIGHGVGVDVHDVIGFEELRQNMVMTIEPGIYSSKEGIGMRIEDVIQITNKGPKNMSAALDIGY